MTSATSTRPPEKRDAQVMAGVMTFLLLMPICFVIGFLAWTGQLHDDPNTTVVAIKSRAVTVAFVLAIISLATYSMFLLLFRTNSHAYDLRSKWRFRLAIISSFPLLVIMPAGTIIGVIGIWFLCRTRRDALGAGKTVAP
jgi:hypothetical protein